MRRNCARDPITRRKLVKGLVNERGPVGSHRLRCTRIVPAMSLHLFAVPLSGTELTTVPLVPATFRQPLAAALIDFVLTGFVVVSLGKLCATSKALADVCVVPLGAWDRTYSAGRNWDKPTTDSIPRTRCE